jgi:surface polysaccharide O-acyltransferase-like enzyme
MSDLLIRVLRFPSKIEYFIFNKHLLLSFNLILLTVFDYSIIKDKQPMYFFLYLIILPFTLILKPKLLLKSNQILFMAFFTYFTVPFSLNFLIGLQLRISIPLFLIFTFLTTIIFFFMLYFINRKHSRKEFLDHSKIALDIIRFIFVVIVTISAVTGKLINDFSLFTQMIPDFKIDTNLEEVRSYFQLTFQILAIPFVFSSTLLRIAVDWLLLKK